MYSAYKKEWKCPWLGSGLEKSDKEPRVGTRDMSECGMWMDRKKKQRQRDGDEHIRYL